MPEHTPAPTPSRAVYGFCLYLGSNILFLVYLTWAIIPEEWFRSVNITYLPKQYWAVAIPVFLLTVLATFTLIIYPSLNLCLTPKIDDIRTVTEVKFVNNSVNDTSCDTFDMNHRNNFSNDFCCCKHKDRCFRSMYVQLMKSSEKYAVPPVKDLCLEEVSKTLYLK